MTRDFTVSQCKTLAVLNLAILNLTKYFKYSKLSIIRPGRSRLLEFEKKVVLVV